MTDTFSRHTDFLCDDICECGGVCPHCDPGDTDCNVIALPARKLTVDDILADVHTQVDKARARAGLPPWNGDGGEAA